MGIFHSKQGWDEQLSARGSESHVATAHSAVAWEGGGVNPTSPKILNGKMRDLHGFTLW